LIKEPIKGGVHIITCNGVMTGNNINLNAQNTLLNQSGDITATNNLNLKANQAEVGLLILKQLENLSDERVVLQFKLQSKLPKILE
jgi:hypothetical protein